MAGRPPNPKRKNTNYMIQFPDQDFINRLDQIAKREGISRKALLLRFCEEGFEKHEPGNPQTLLNSYEEGGIQSMNQLVGRIRQDFYRRGQASNREILKRFMDAGIDNGKKRVELTKNTIEWLKGHDIAVTYP